MSFAVRILSNVCRGRFVFCLNVFACAASVIELARMVNNGGEAWIPHLQRKVQFCIVFLTFPEPDLAQDAIMALNQKVQPAIPPTVLKVRSFSKSTR